MGGEYRSQAQFGLMKQRDLELLTTLFILLDVWGLTAISLSVRSQFYPLCVIGGGRVLSFMPRQGAADICYLLADFAILVRRVSEAGCADSQLLSQRNMPKKGHC